MSKKLEDLLEKGRTLNAEYKNGLMSSHLPMALIALSEMGASDTRLEDFYQLYARRLQSKPAPVKDITRTNWKDDLGQHQYNTDYALFFENEIDQNGLDTVLETYLPELMPGISGGAFHPMIRLAYALDIQSTSEAAEALASWAIAFQDLPNTAQNNTPQNDIAKMLNALSSDEDVQDIEIIGDNIAEKIKTVAESPAFQFHMNKLDLTAQDLDDVCDVMVQIFGETRGFTVLHAVTSASALRKVLPYLDQDEQELALGHYGDALLATYVTVDMPELTPCTLDETDKSWSEIFNQIVTSNNDHAIKLVYTCHQESQRHPQKDIYKRVASDLAFPKTP